MENKTNNNFTIKLFLLVLLIWQSPLFGVAKEKSLKDAPQTTTIDFKLLEKTEEYVTGDKADLKEIPADILVLNGKLVKVTGYFLIPSQAYYLKESVSNFGVSKNSYGCPCCTWGDPPTIFNTVIVDMRQGEVVEPPFTPLIEVTGIFNVKKEQITDEEGGKRLNTLFYIKDAKAVKKKQSFLKSISN